MSSCGCRTGVRSGPAQSDKGTWVQRKGATPASEPPCPQCQAEAALVQDLLPPPAGPGDAAPPPDLTIGAPGDAFEREADGIADRVMRGEPPPGSSGGAAPSLQRLPTATRAATGAPAGIREVLDSPGRPLDPTSRSDFEPAFGHDFSSVRVHADDRAERSAHALDAQAYTLGHHLIFARGRYAPETREGRRLLAHELAHVVQQSRSPAAAARVQRKKGRGPGSCGLISAFAATFLGSMAHVQIQTKLATRGIRPELAIPRATKASGLSPRCQKLGTIHGFADVARLGVNPIGVGEIKPYAVAKILGRVEAKHYQRRATQSKQRLTLTGNCGRKSGPGPDDLGFAADVGGIGPTTSFIRISRVISGIENFGPYVLDKNRDLKAEEVGGGGIGYWCALNATGKKNKKNKKKSKARAASVGVGVAIGGSQASAASAGVGVSIDSDSATAATAGAGIAISSDTAAAGAVGAGISKDSTSVGGAAAGAGMADSSDSAGVATAGAGKVQNSMTAGAGVAGTGEIDDSLAATAGATGSGKTEGVVGASTGSPQGQPKSFDPEDATRPEADQQHPADADAEAGEGGDENTDSGEGGSAEQSGAGGKAGEGGTSATAGGDKEAGAGGDEKTAAGKDATGTRDKGTGTGADAGSAATPAPLAVLPIVPLGTSEADRDKIAAEAAKVAKLLAEASDPQQGLLRHLADSSPDQRYMVPTSEWVQKMMDVTEGLSAQEIEYLEELDWQPGKISEEELRERIDALLADRSKKPAGAEGETETSKASAEEASGESAGADDGGKGGKAGKGKGQGAGEGGERDAKGDTEKGTETGESSVGGTDHAVDPPADWDRTTAGIFSFKILSGFTLHGTYEKGDTRECEVLIEDKKAGRFKLTGVSIVFEEPVIEPVKIGGQKFERVKLRVHFEKDFASPKREFYGLGGEKSSTLVDMGRRKVQ